MRGLAAAPISFGSVRYDAGVAQGRTHETINLVALGGLAALYTYGRAQGIAPQLDATFPPPARFLFVLSFLIGTFLITPDLDLAENHVRAKSHWGLLGLLWVPYGMMFSHRGLSHTWFVGPLTRFVYLCALLVGFGYLASAFGPFVGYTFSVRVQLVENWRELALGALAGYYLSQWLHLLADAGREAAEPARRRVGEESWGR